VAHRHASIDDLGDGVFRKLRRELGITAFGFRRVQLDAVIARITEFGITPIPLPGAERMAIGTFGSTSRAAAEVRIGEICDKLLANPVIEDYRFEISAE